MGYTHYFYRKEELPKAAFEKVVADFTKVAQEIVKAGIPLADGHGEGKAKIGPDEIRFNGLEKCGHAQRDFGIAWPSPTAGGAKQDADTRNGYWFGGALLEKRSCGGDCSHETFSLPRILPKDGYRSALDAKDEAGRIFGFTKTAYKPYDIAVTAVLIIAKKHLGDLINVKSDGDDKDWFDAKRVCQEVLGYGLEFVMNEELVENR